MGLWNELRAFAATVALGLALDLMPKEAEGYEDWVRSIKVVAEGHAAAMKGNRK